MIPGRPIRHDAIIVGSGVSGSFIAQELAQAGMKCLMLEAGERFERGTYASNELDANSRLSWAGGLELNHDASVVFLRPKVVVVGSVVNQALVDGRHRTVRTQRGDDGRLDRTSRCTRILLGIAYRGLGYCFF